MSFSEGIQSNPLREVSFLPGEAYTLNRQINVVARAELLSKNLRTYENEVLRDETVSLPYEINDKTIEGFDPRERGGVFISGFNTMRGLLRKKPGEAIVWYSPPGPASFEEDPVNPYSEITFNYGQLYIQYFDGKKERAVAIKVKNEDVVSQLLPSISTFANNFRTEKERIEYFIRHPFATGFSIDAFLAHNWRNDHVYTSNQGKNSYLREVLAEVRNKFASDEPSEPDAKILRLVQNDLTENDIKRVYAESIHAEMVRRGGRSLKMQGSCGAREQHISDIEKLLGIDNIFSSKFRLSQQETEKNWSYHDGECVVCKAKTKVGPCEICKTCEKVFDEEAKVA